MKYVRKEIQELKEYKVPQEKYEVKLNQNESPYDVPLNLKKEILKRMLKINWNRYPPRTANPLVEAIAKYNNFPKNGIVAGNASNEIIQAVFQTFCEKKDKVTFVSPSFPIYTYLAKIMNLTIIEVPLLEDFSFDIRSIIKKGKNSKMVVLAVPNNPTGTTIFLPEIEEIAKNINGVLVLDEAYFEFSKETAVPLLNKYENLVIIRTLSKAFGLAGLRIGYLLSNETLASQIQKAKLPFSLGIFSQVAGEVLLKNKEYKEEVVKKIIKERENIFSKLQDLPGIEPIPSYTNFILFKTKFLSGKELFEELYKKGVLLRYFDNPRLKNTLRVTIGKTKENKIFIERLREVINEKNIC
ncbi:MAG: histidinol-phosphate transaminase [candidate division WOR-3 bacterium]